LEFRFHVWAFRADKVPGTTAGHTAERAGHGPVFRDQRARKKPELK
jgi:hypothetical protein